MPCNEIIVATRCPHCGAWNDAHTTEGNQPIRPGDYSLCFLCKQVAIFDEDDEGKPFVRPPRDDERDVIMAHPTVRRYLAAMRESFTPHEAIKLARDE